MLRWSLLGPQLFENILLHNCSARSDPSNIVALPSVDAVFFLDYIISHVTVVCPKIHAIVSRIVIFGHHFNLTGLQISLRNKISKINWLTCDRFHVHLNVLVRATLINASWCSRRSQSICSYFSSQNVSRIIHLSFINEIKQLALTTSSLPSFTRLRIRFFYLKLDYNIFDANDLNTRHAKRTNLRLKSDLYFHFGAQLGASDDRPSLNPTSLLIWSRSDLQSQSFAKVFSATDCGLYHLDDSCYWWLADCAWQCRIWRCLMAIIRCNFIYFFCHSLRGGLSVLKFISKWW